MYSPATNPTVCGNIPSSISRCSSVSNPLSCGSYDVPVKECSCTSIPIARYQKKISAPLLDRIDIHLEVPRVDYENLADNRNVEDSKTIRARVQATCERQVESFLQIGLCLGIFPDASYDGVSHFSEVRKNT